MKRWISLLLLICMVCSLCGCGGSFASVDLQEPQPIPQDGIVTEKVFRQLKEENTIGIFYGTSNDFTYEWTIFGSDIETAKDLNLSAAISASLSESGLVAEMAQPQTLDFSAVLSIHVNEIWDALSATVYRCDGDREEPLCSASITGQGETILNFSLTEIPQRMIIRPDVEQTEIGSMEAPVVSSDTPDSAAPTQTQTSAPNQSETPTTEKKPASTEAPETQSTSPAPQDDYLSAVQKDSNRVYSDGSRTEQDEYKTDPIPEGKPVPVEPENQNVDAGAAHTCTLSIECSTILNNMSNLDPDKREEVPSDGVILSAGTVTFYEGESVFDLLKRVCRDSGIPMEFEWTPIYNSAYVQGIHNLYEFDCGGESGWMYRVNGWYPNYGCSRYQLAEGDVVEWRYTCNGLGKDIGCDWMA